MLLRKTPVALALSTLFVSVGAIAQSAPAPATAASAAQPHQLGEVTVSATRTERSTSAVPNTVSVYNKAALDRRDARDLKDLLANEADVAVRAVAPRFTAAGASTGRGGNEGLNIRGMEGNRVLIMVDGIRMPASFSFGAFSSGRLDYVDVNGLASAEVLRGPASTQYGSDGLAGALILRTLSPEDLLKDGKTFAGTARFGALTADNSRYASAAVAFSGGADQAWTTLVQFSRRQGHETKNEGTNKSLNSTRTAPDPLDITTNSLLAKVGYRVNAAHKLQATLELREREMEGDVLSARAPAATAATSVLALSARDKLSRERVSLEHRYEDLNGVWLQQATTHVYVQDGDTRQFSFEDRNTSADRIRDGHYRERLVGLTSQGQTQLSNQRLSFGIDVSRNTIDGIRDGTVPPAGESFPSKPFPDTKYTLAGAFAQSEWELGDVTVIPALRFESYKLSPKTEGYTGGEVKALSDHAFVPRLGAIWRVTDQFQPYAQWALGFHAPTPDQVNNSFANPLQGYRSIGNPNLKAEHANSIEVGLRGKLSDTLRWQLSAYDNRYKDFIDRRQVSGAGTLADPMVFQFINLQNVRIKGAEARVMWKALPGLDLSFALASLSGKVKENGVETPHDATPPLRANLTARYETGDWLWQAAWQHVDSKKSKDIALANGFPTPSYDVLDVGGSYRINKTLSVSAFVTNLTDKKYWRWNDVRDQTRTSAVLDAFTATGRALQLSLRADF